ncbi:hypothetical protein B0T19DRAFT_402679 [Cercophora scortea]|uniref:Uncharacterized protein n=1 Tax=Cercophora scortea TaxID=314031 RepID=A0AAE0IGS3_9PEZI|nr:hypothetical protein B0T19DRAFT_402679 [Cercophora scortea]
MRPYHFLVVPFLATQSSGHGLITLIKGANGVNMPGLNVADGTPRNCNTRICGSHSDTAIIRDHEILAGQVGPLGRTRTNRTIDAATQISIFMGKVPPPPPANFTTVAQACSTGPAIQPKFGNLRSIKRQTNTTASIHGICSGSPTVQPDFSGFRFHRTRSAVTAADAAAASNNGTASDQCACLVEFKADFINARSVTSNGGMFNAVWRLFGRGGRGIVNIETRQKLSSTPPLALGPKLACQPVNEDGAGPLDAHIDSTSGGTQAPAFRKAQITLDVPGKWGNGSSEVTSTYFPLRIKMPADMTCDGVVAGVENVCVVRVRNWANTTETGPFGGSAAFTQSAAARKRALDVRGRRRPQAFSG